MATLRPPTVPSLRNEKKTLFPREMRAKLQTAQLRKKCIAVLNPQRVCDPSVFIFDCDEFRHTWIEKRGDFASPRSYFGFKDFLNAVKQILRAEWFCDVIIYFGNV